MGYLVKDGLLHKNTNELQIYYLGVDGRVWTDKYFAEPYKNKKIAINRAQRELTGFNMEQLTAYDPAQNYGLAIEGGVWVHIVQIIEV